MLSLLCRPFFRYEMGQSFEPFGFRNDIFLNNGQSALHGQSTFPPTAGWPKLLSPPVLKFSAIGMFMFGVFFHTNTRAALRERDMPENQAWVSAYFERIHGQYHGRSIGLRGLVARGLRPEQGDDNLSPVAVRAVFKQINSLPGTQ